MEEARLQLDGHTVYDAPETLFSMAWDGELTARGLRNAVAAPHLLSPLERDTIQDRVVASMGGSTVARTLVETATNPWVLLMLATSPAAHSALKTGEAITSLAAKASPFVRTKGGILQALGALGPFEVLRGTASADVGFQVTKGSEKLFIEFGEEIGDAVNRVNRAFGLKTGQNLDWTLLKNSADQQRLKRFMFALQGRLEGWDQAIEVVEGGKRVVRPALVQQNLDAVLGEIDGGLDLAAGLRRALDKRMVRLLGADEEVAHLSQTIIDRDKVARLWHGVRENELFGQGIVKTPQGSIEQLVTTLMPDDIMKAVRDGDMSLDAFDNYVQQGLGAEAMSNHFFPRTARNLYRSNGRTLTTLSDAEMDARALQNRLSVHGMKEARSALPMIEAGDLAYLGQEFGATDELRKWTQVMEDMGLDAAKKSGDWVFQAVRPHDAIHKFSRQSAATYNWHITKPDSLVLDALSKGPLAAEDLTNPLGGVPSLSQIVAREYPLITDEYARHVITDYLVPVSSGIHDPRSIIGQQVMNHAKQATSAIFHGPLGKMIEGTGRRGAQFVDDMRTFSAADLGTEALNGTSSHMSANIAKYLYTTHLGFNLGSIMLNLTQPFLLGATWVGGRNTLKGYNKALREVWGYMDERAAQKFRVLTEAEKRGLIKKHFQFADHEGVDLLQLTGSIFEDLDAIAFRSSQRGTGLFNRYFEWSMAGFEKAEWLNRSVMAHAVSNAYRGAGAAMDTPQFFRDIRDLVSQTQFGANLMTTPMAFASSANRISPSGRLFNNPLMRQFIQFPLRSFTGITKTAGNIGQSQRQIFGKTVTGRIPATAIDFARGMGISAAIYEVTKSTVGTDFSRGLFFGASTDIIGGDRFTQQDSPIPTPPVISIPFDLAKGALGGDYALMQRSASRMLPAGVALHRAVGVSPDLPLPGGDLAQSRFADWQNIQDGKVPIRRADGSLIAFEDPLLLTLKGVGADLSKYNTRRKLERSIMGNRDEIRLARREYIRAMVNGDMMKARRVKNNFEKRFGKGTFTVSRQQLNAYLGRVEQTSLETLLGQIPANMRGGYVRAAAATQPGTFVQSPEGPTPRQQRVSQDRIRELEAQMARLQEERVQESRSFGETFGGF